MILKSFSKKVDISIYIHGVPHKPDICCIDFFSVVYFILSNNILICSPFWEVWMSRQAVHTPQPVNLILLKQKSMFVAKW